MQRTNELYETGNAIVYLDSGVFVESVTNDRDAIEKALVKMRAWLNDEKVSGEMVWLIEYEDSPNTYPEVADV